MTEPRQSSLLIWSTISLLLLLIYIIYRRRQTKTNEEQIPSRESSEYRLSAGQVLPTITEENPATLTPSNSNHHFPPFSSSTTTPSPLVLGKKKNNIFCQKYQSLSFSYWR